MKKKKNPVAISPPKTVFCSNSPPNALEKLKLE